LAPDPTAVDFRVARLFTVLLASVTAGCHTGAMVQAEAPNDTGCAGDSLGSAEVARAARSGCL